MSSRNCGWPLELVRTFGVFRPMSLPQMLATEMFQFVNFSCAGRDYVSSFC